MSLPIAMRINKKEEYKEHIGEAIVEEDGVELLPDDKFYTVTMAEILERQGLKKDAMKIYQILLKKGGQ
ncbi:MAG: hypothetical protein HZB54_00065, partial [Deltaproteobacteria bacterium]|nr:hypothetical protein [Deltaproteobacteria bacterium]